MTGFHIGSKTRLKWVELNVTLITNTSFDVMCHYRRSTIPANIYLLKLVIKTLEKDMTYAPS